MSSISAPSTSIGRPTSVTAAIGLILLLLALTAPTVIVSMDGFDAVFVAIATVLATIKLIGVAGLWNCRKWGMYIAFAAVAIDTLLGAGSMLDTNGAASVVLMLVNAIVGVVVLVLLTRQSSRRAYV